MTPGYSPHDQGTLAWVGAVLLGSLVLGALILRVRIPWLARTLAWTLALGGTALVERLCAAEPAGLRMLALIGTLLYGMKAVVGVEERLSEGRTLPPGRWLCFAAGWPGMRPGAFAGLGKGPRTDSGKLLLMGLVRFLAGLTLALLAWATWRERDMLGEVAACVLATVFLLPGLSLMLHFGIFNILAGLWRRLGADTRPLFRAPLAAPSLADFWSRRWNLAFSEMTALGVYRPLSRLVGKGPATAGAFLFSGLLHELAISVPVEAGYGLPMAYFVLHGLLVLVERRLERWRIPVSSWGIGSHAWVIGWLLVPLPVLFHLPFLRGVVWPLIGMAP